MPDLLPDLDGPNVAPANGGPPQQLVVLLHGLGADGNDLIGLVPAWAGLLPNAQFVAPDAPFPCDMGPYGRQWFSFQDRTPERVLASVRGSAPILDAWLDRTLAALGLDDTRLALVGFSQGTMMTLQIGLRRARAPAALIGYSGALIGPETLPTEIRARPPVLLVHGDADAVVPVRALDVAGDVLAANRVPVERLLRRGLGHGIDEDGLRRGGAFLRQHLGQPG